MTMNALAVRQMTTRAEFARLTHFARIPVGVPLENVLKPTFWQHMVPSLNVNDLIEIVAEDGSYDLLARVVDKDVGFVKLRVLFKVEDESERVEPGEEDTADNDELPRIQHIPRGSAQGWRLLGYNGETVREKIKTKGEAAALLEDYKARSGG